MTPIAVCDVRILPVGTGSTSMAPLVARAYEVARKSGLRHELTATATILEGPMEELLQVVGRMHGACLTGEVQRVVTSITLDERRDLGPETVTLGRRVSAVMEECSRELSPA